MGSTLHGIDLGPASGAARPKPGLKICLISIPTATDFEDPEQFEGAGVRSVSTDIPLGTLTLASALEGTGFAPQIVDSNRWYIEYLFSDRGARKVPFSRFAAERLAAMDADVFGFGTICNSYPVTLQIAQRLKALRPEAVTLLGGPQASVVDLPTLAAFPFVDFILRGEADRSLPEFAQRLADGLPVETIAGLSYSRSGQPHRNPGAPLPTDMDTLPMPAFHLYPGMEDIRIIPLELGRGCPFGCTFCSTNEFFSRRFRLKSPAKLIAEMDFLLSRYTVDFFDLMHDMFTVDRKRVRATCEAMLATGRKYRWGCSARSDFVDPELIDLMARAGCVSIFFGIESGSERMQKVFGKRLDIEQARLHADLCSRHGMKTTVSTIVGFPEETEQDLRETLRFIGQSLLQRNNIPQMHLLAPLPGTPLEKEHRHELVLEDIYTDMSHSGWVQDSAERRLIAEHPDVFPNFYAIPTPHLDRRYLHELREFVGRVCQRFRWTAAALHAGGSDLLSVYDEWRAWSRPLVQDNSLRRYYCSWGFDRDFVAYLLERGPHTEFERVLLNFEEELIRAVRPRSCQRTASAALEVLHSDMRLEREPYVYVLHLRGDVNRVVESLETNRPPDAGIDRPTIVATRLTGGDEAELIEITPVLAEFLNLCDGSLTVDEVLTRVAGLCEPVGRLSAWDVAAYALRKVYERKLIRAEEAEMQLSATPMSA